MSCWHPKKKYLYTNTVYALAWPNIMSRKRVECGAIFMFYSPWHIFSPSHMNTTEAMKHSLKFFFLHRAREMSSSSERVQENIHKNYTICFVCCIARTFWLLLLSLAAADVYVVPAIMWEVKNAEEHMLPAETYFHRHSPPPLWLHAKVAMKTNTI